MSEDKERDLSNLVNGSVGSKKSFSNTIDGAIRYVWKNVIKPGIKSLAYNAINEGAHMTIFDSPGASQANGSNPYHRSSPVTRVTQKPVSVYSQGGWDLSSHIEIPVKDYASGIEFARVIEEHLSQYPDLTVLKVLMWAKRPGDPDPSSNSQLGKFGWKASTGGIAGWKCIGLSDGSYLLRLPKARPVS